jgi:hypothetical protein
MTMMIHFIAIHFLLIVVYTCGAATTPMLLTSSWDHHVAISNDFHLSWTASEMEIVFMVQVRTRGCFGFGFSRDGSVHNADIVIGWIDNGGESSFYVSTALKLLRKKISLYIMTHNLRAKSLR